MTFRQARQGCRPQLRALVVGAHKEAAKDVYFVAGDEGNTFSWILGQVIEQRVHRRVEIPIVGLLCA